MLSACNTFLERAITHSPLLIHLAAFAVIDHPCQCHRGWGMMMLLMFPVQWILKKLPITMWSTALHDDTRPIFFFSNKSDELLLLSAGVGKFIYIKNGSITEKQ